MYRMIGWDERNVGRGRGGGNFPIKIHNMIVTDYYVMEHDCKL